MKSLSFAVGGQPGGSVTGGLADPVEKQQHSPRKPESRSLLTEPEGPSGRTHNGPRLPATAVLPRVRSGGLETIPSIASGDLHWVSPALRKASLERFDELDVAIDPDTRTYWCHMNPRERPSFTLGLLRDLAKAQQTIKNLFAAQPEPEDPPLRYYVLASQLPGIFNLGGNLSLFADRIRQKDRVSLEAYARACIEVLYTNAVSFDQPVVTIALVQGEALGGGFEAALSCNVIIAERGAKFGLPEVLFNLFPGMGAYSFLSRRLGAARAEDLILSGKVYSAEEMHEMGLVHAIAEPGCGKAAVKTYISRHERRHSAHSAIYRAGHAVNPLTMNELLRVADLWVETSLQLREADLRLMERLVARQDRRRFGPQLLAAE